MKTIKLNKLKLENFMGIKDFTFAPQGENCTLAGDNATGKTTVASAFTWLLFDEDIYGNNTSNFTIKTKDITGNVIPAIDHSVEALIEVNGTPISLKKIYREVWTKKRGSASSVLTSHSTDHFFDNEPLKKKDYDAQIEQIMSKDMFRLCTSVTAFENLHWTKKREVLLSLCAGQEIEADLYRAEKQKKILLAKKKEINDAIDDIPPRISELNKSLDAIAEYDAKKIREQLASLEKQINEIRDDATLSVLRKERAELEGKISQLKAEGQKVWQARQQELWSAYNSLKTEKTIKDEELGSLERRQNELEGEIDLCESKLKKFKAEFSDLSSASEADVSNTCPTCHQSLPEEQVQAAREKHNLKLSQELEAINAKGRAEFGRLKKLKEEKDQFGEPIINKQQDCALIEKALSKAKNELDEYSRTPGEPTTRDMALKTALESALDEINEKLRTKSVTQNTTGLEAERLELQARLAEIESARRAKTRIVELKEEKKDLDVRYERVEQDLFEAEKEISEKAAGLEEEINGKFGLVRFSLFEILINQGIKPTCVAEVKGISPGRGLNSAGEVEAGLDIITTLQRHYDVNVVLFLDHKESITKNIETPFQLITLVVDPKYKKLHVEVLDK